MIDREETLQIIRIKSDQLPLPPEIARNLKGKAVQFLEIDGGYLLKPIGDPIKEAKGCLKDKRFSTQNYFMMKNELHKCPRF